MRKNLRQDRLNDYEAMRGPSGFSRSKEDLDYWAKRASENSEIAPRATGTRSNNGSREPHGDLPDLHSTGKKMELRDTESRPLARHSKDARMVAKADKNFAGSSTYMKGIRRTTT
jgi:hypothetical protein